MDNLEDFIKIPLYHSIIEDKIFKGIQKEVKDYIDKNKEQFSLAWNCPTLSSINFPKEKDINSPFLINEVKFHVEQYFKKWDFEGKNFGLRLGKIWVNISPPMSYQDQHYHIDRHKLNQNIFSGVLYIDVPKNSGDLQFNNPLLPYINHLPRSNKHLDRIIIPSKNQEIIIFPSFLEHSVGTNFSEQERISVSWNIEVINK
jgi:uncharacterized protein (TIGR02466 family)